MSDTKNSVRMRQAYLANTERAAVRIRVAGDKATLNIKHMRIGPSRSEYEYPVPLEDALEVLEKLCISAEVCKTRYYLELGTHTWEIDVFEGENAGLIVAEIELGSEDEEFTRPGWLGEEVTHDERFYNAALARLPYCRW